MRTTVTLDTEIANKLKELCHKKKISFKVMLNQTLERGLQAQIQALETREPFLARPHSLGFKPGIDLSRLNQLVDELDTADFVAEALKSS